MNSIKILSELKAWLREKEQEMYKSHLRAESNHERKDAWTYHGKRQAFYDTIVWLRKQERQDKKMLTTFEIKVVADVNERNQNDVDAFKELLRQEAQTLWTMVTVMAPGAEIEVAMNNLDLGTVQLDLFKSGDEDIATLGVE